MNQQDERLYRIARILRAVVSEMEDDGMRVGDAVNALHEMVCEFEGIPPDSDAYRRSRILFNEASA